MRSRCRIRDRTHQRYNRHGQTNNRNNRIRIETLGHTSVTRPQLTPTHAFHTSIGGGEMGRSWYEDQGRCLTKKNSSLDFVSVADYLINQQWTQVQGYKASFSVLNEHSDMSLVCLVSVHSTPPFLSSV